jgi:hypothetical protein
MGSVVMGEYGHKFGNQPQRRKVHGMTSPFLASVLGLQAGYFGGGILSDYAA